MEDENIVCKLTLKCEISEPMTLEQVKKLKEWVDSLCYRNMTEYSCYVLLDDKNNLYEFAR